MENIACASPLRMLPEATVAETISNLIATIGENMMLRRAARFEVAHGAVAAYIHNAVAPELGRIGVLAQPLQ